MMIKKNLIVCGLLFCSTLVAQNRIKFEYDQAGNQVKRFICLNCSSRMADTKSENNLTEKDFVFDEYYDVKYYPNPVEEVLFISINNSENSKAESIIVYDTNGKFLDTVDVGNSNKDYFSIPFAHYPKGFYILSISFTDGKKKSIKILKN